MFRMLVVQGATSDSAGCVRVQESRPSPKSTEKSVVASEGPFLIVSSLSLSLSLPPSLYLHFYSGIYLRAYINVPIHMYIFTYIYIHTYISYTTS